MRHTKKQKTVTYYRKILSNKSCFKEAQMIGYADKDLKAVIINTFKN